MCYSNYATTYEDINGSYTCVYCGNTQLVIDDSFNEYGNYEGTINYCDCEQAILEQQMKREMSQFESKKKEIEKAYKKKLKYNSKAIATAKLKESLSELTRDVIMYGELNGMTKEEFLEIAAEEYDHQVWDEEDDEEYE